VIGSLPASPVVECPLMPAPPACPYGTEILPKDLVIAGQS